MLFGHYATAIVFSDTTAPRMIPPFSLTDSMVQCTLLLAETKESSRVLVVDGSLLLEGQEFSRVDYIETLSDAQRIDGGFRCRENRGDGEREQGDKRNDL